MILYGILALVGGCILADKAKKNGFLSGLSGLAAFAGFVMLSIGILAYPYGWIFSGYKEEQDPADTAQVEQEPKVATPSQNHSQTIDAQPAVPKPRDNDNDARRDDAQDAEEAQLVRLDGLREQALVAGLSNTKNCNGFAAVGHAYLWKAGEFKSSTTRDVALVRAHGVYLKAGLSFEDLGYLDTAYGIYAQAGVVAFIADKALRTSSPSKLLGISPREYFLKYGTAGEKRMTVILSSPRRVTLVKDLQEIEAAYVKKAHLFFLNQTE